MQVKVYVNGITVEFEGETHASSAASGIEHAEKLIEKAGSKALEILTKSEKGE